LVRVGLTVRGVVQGVGFRPGVCRVARELGLTGFVRNGRGAVRIEAQGARVDELVSALWVLPAPIAVEHLDREELADGSETSFEIAPSDEAAAVEAALPPDLAVCVDCAAEIDDPKARRHRYPFTNCTRCGPRFSIVDALPYDRARTSMKLFELCADCALEYASPADRRFHAEPIACPACGPALTLLDPSGKKLAAREEALQRAAALLRQGGILALRALGGFQLLTDATDEAAVRRLRQRKHREEKPFGVLFESLEQAQRHLFLSDEAARALTSPEAPIMLVRRRNTSSVTAAVAPDNPRLGALLPYSPLHRVLAKAVGRPLVCTSGNRSEEPMCTGVTEALAELGAIADELLVHNREIVRPIDDSVAELGPTGLRLVRRARGFAPRPVAGHRDGAHRAGSRCAHEEHGGPLAPGSARAQSAPGRSGDARGDLRARARSGRPVPVLRRGPGCRGLRSAPGLCVERARRAPGGPLRRAAGARAAPPCARGFGPGRARSARSRAGPLVGRHGPRSRRHDLGW
jgi:hydrogenase maturation protein HypF